ncbi:MAG: cobalt transporter CbiM [Actinomycetota bacterium]|nr:cobalt transporter CbiM [Actinomycetota bacterium]
MHIPDGYLSPQTYVAMYGVMTPIWVVAARKVRQTLRRREVPRLALAAAFSFVVMLFSLPVPGGTTAHPAGGALIAIVLGPWAAVISMSVALTIQAFVFGDGGITALGANCFSAAFVGPFVGYWIWKFLAGRQKTSRRALLGAAIAGFISINATAQVAAVLVGIQPLIARGADGRPLYFPYPLSVTMPAMAFSHVFVGLAEAFITAGVLAYLAREEIQPITGDFKALEID